MKGILYLVITLFLLSCGSKDNSPCDEAEGTRADTSHAETKLIGTPPPQLTDISIVVLGVCQDGGSPHAGCEKNCCKDLFQHPDPDRMVVSLGVVDPVLQERYIFEATPDFPGQMHFLEKSSGFGFDRQPDGIFITHAHMGHYSGLMHLGKEAMNADNVPVYVMPKMKSFLENNGPWNQLVDIDNIELVGIQNEQAVEVNEHLVVVPFIVPHRDEYSETVGYRIEGPKKSAIFIPDIDKWEKWNKDIIYLISTVDYAFIDATFYDQNELKNRNMSEIPHPFVIESMALFKDLPAEEKAKIIFIHLNHTNPLLNERSEASQTVLENGFRIAKKGDVYPL